MIGSHLKPTRVHTVCIQICRIKDVPIFSTSSTACSASLLILYDLRKYTHHKMILLHGYTVFTHRRITQPSAYIHNDLCTCCYLLSSFKSTQYFSLLYIPSFKHCTSVTTILMEFNKMSISLSLCSAVCQRCTMCAVFPQVFQPLSHSFTCDDMNSRQWTGTGQIQIKYYEVFTAALYHALDPVPVQILSPELFCFSQGPSSTEIS